MAPVTPATPIINNPNLWTEREKGTFRTRIISVGVGSSITFLALVLFLVARGSKEVSSSENL